MAEGDHIWCHNGPGVYLWQPYVHGPGDHPQQEKLLHMVQGTDFGGQSVA